MRVFLGLVSKLKILRKGTISVHCTAVNEVYLQSWDGRAAFMLLLLSPASSFTLQRCHHLPALWLFFFLAPKAALVPPLTLPAGVCCAW